MKPISAALYGFTTLRGKDFTFKYMTMHSICKSYQSSWSNI